MADSVTNLQQMIANVETQILALTTSAYPSVSLDGESVDLGAERDRLVKLRDDLRKQLINEEGPAEEHVQGWC
jgi:hypothetical protein